MSHIISPKMMFATESNLLSVSVISSLDCADAAYALVFMTMEFEKMTASVKNHWFIEKNQNFSVDTQLLSSCNCKIVSFCPT